MPTIKSDLTNKSFDGNQMMQFDVSDESQEMPSDEIDALNRRMAERGLPPLDENTINQMYKHQNKQVNNQNDLSTTERAVKEARIAKATGKTRLNDGAKRRVEALCGIMRSTKSVDIEGNIFSLRTLKTKEMREALLEASKFDGTVESPFEIRKQLLARSLYEIAGADATLFLGDSSLYAMFEFLDEQDESLLVRLFSEYSQLANSADKRYSIKNDVDAKEVIDDLKK